MNHGTTFDADCACSLGTSSLSSSPAQINGVVTACRGEPIQLTCTHGNTVSGNTRWIVGPPVDCAETISSSVSPGQSCEPVVTFQDDSMLSEGVVSSIAMIATDNISINGTVLECRDGAGLIFNTVGNVSICTIGRSLGSPSPSLSVCLSSFPFPSVSLPLSYTRTCTPSVTNIFTHKHNYSNMYLLSFPESAQLPVPTELSYTHIDNGLEVSWDSVAFESCIFSFNIRYVSVSGGIAGNVRTNSTSALLEGLRSDEQYNISVTSVIGSSCASNSATIITTITGQGMWLLSIDDYEC